MVDSFRNQALAYFYYASLSLEKEDYHVPSLEIDQTKLKLTKPKLEIEINEVQNEAKNYSISVVLNVLLLLNKLKELKN